MISFRTLHVDRRKTTSLMALSGLESTSNLLNENNQNNGDRILESKICSQSDTSLMLMVWQQRSKNSDRIRIHVINFFNITKIYYKSKDRVFLFFWYFIIYLYITIFADKRFWTINNFYKCKLKKNLIEKVKKLIFLIYLIKNNN